MYSIVSRKACAYTKLTLLTVFSAVVILAAPPAKAGAFGEIAVSVGGTYPQGSFTRYADAGVLINIRATIHAPVVEFASTWVDISIVPFSRDVQQTFSVTEIFNGPTIIRPVEQITSKTMIAAHIGLQIANPTRRGFFRPRVALGIGLYNFQTDVTWEEEINDSTTITLASEDIDTQNSFGWRGMIGADFFVSPQLGFTTDFVYDQVFNLRQEEGPDDGRKLTSRFHGFSVGVVFMFGK